MTRLAGLGFLVATLCSAAVGVASSATVGRFAAPPADASDPAADPTPRVVVPAPVARGIDAETYLDGIMRRNLFDTQIIETWDPTPDDPGAQSRTTLDVSLVGTVVSDPDSLSAAVIRLDADGRTRGYSIGDTVMDRTIVDIQQGLVLLEGPGNKMEELRFDAEATVITPDAPSETSDEDAGSGIEDLGGDRYGISDKVFKNVGSLAGLSALGRVMPSTGADGKLEGFRLSAMRRNETAEQLGLKNGDVLRSVNGNELTSPDAASEAFAGLSDASDFCFEVTRRGAPKKLCYERQ